MTRSFRIVVVVNAGDPLSSGYVRSFDQDLQDQFGLFNRQVPAVKIACTRLSEDLGALAALKRWRFSGFPNCGIQPGSCGRSSVKSF